jgi:ribosomal protein S18 acetylase RimI-like enzyme
VSIVDIRDARYGDWKAVNALFAQCFPFVPAHRRRYVLCSAKRGTRVALLDGRIAGFTVIIPWRQADIAWLDWIAVDPDCHGQGIGTRLSEDLRANTAANGYKALRLGVDHDNPASLALFDNTEGFYRIEEGERITFEAPLTPRPDTEPLRRAGPLAYLFNRLVWQFATDYRAAPLGIAVCNT